MGSLTTPPLYYPPPLGSPLKEPQLGFIVPNKPELGRGPRGGDLNPKP